MKNGCVLFTALLMVVSGCKGYSTHAIDENALNKIDTNLLGIWRVAEDTDRRNFIYVERNYDVHHFSRDYGTRKFKQYEHCYYLTYMNRHGKNARYEQWLAFTSDINGTRFMNITYRNDGEGFFFVRFIKRSANRDTITTCMVADTNLRYLPDSKAVRKKITGSINDPVFYSDTMHIYKISSFHADLRQSMLKANP